MKKAILVIVWAALIVLVVVFRQRIFGTLYSSIPQPLGAEPGMTVEKIPAAERQDMVEVLATDLKVPWEVAFLPGGGILVTERPGTLRKIGPTGFAIAVADVSTAGEGGLMGMALHPNFQENKRIYLYYTTEAGGSRTNRVDSYVLASAMLTERTNVIKDIPGATNHDGGRIAFGPDGKLYVTTGDAGQSANAQELRIMAGKILRLNDDGTIPADNPFGTAVWSYGHRNPQGIVWDDQGRLWATEHGRSGVQSGLDELNLIEKGKNYGWPTIQGDQSRSGMEKPRLHSGERTTWAPAGIAWIGGSLFFGGLRGEALYEADADDTGQTLTAHFHKEYGRLRAVEAGPDGFLYVTTSNTDGRGSVREGDDKLLKIDPRLFDK